MYDQTRAQQPASNLPGRDARRTPGPEPLLPSDERNQLNLRLQKALNTFADNPTQALEGAEAAFDEATAQLMNVLAERRRVLHAAWQEQDGEHEGEQEQGEGQSQVQDPEARSTELRLALRQYREITQRLLRI